MTEDSKTAWCQPMDCGKHKPRTFMVWFEDAERGIAVFDNEPEARAFWEQANINWNCYLFGALPLAAAPVNASMGEGALVMALRAQAEAEKLDDAHRELVDRAHEEGWDEVTGSSHLNDDWQRVLAARARARELREIALCHPYPDYKPASPHPASTRPRVLDDSDMHGWDQQTQHFLGKHAETFTNELGNKIRLVAWTSPKVRAGEPRQSGGPLAVRYILWGPRSHTFQTMTPMEAGKLVSQLQAALGACAEAAPSPSSELVAALREAPGAIARLKELSQAARIRGEKYIPVLAWDLTKWSELIAALTTEGQTAGIDDRLRAAFLEGHSAGQGDISENGEACWQRSKTRSGLAASPSPDDTTREIQRVIDDVKFGRIDLRPIGELLTGKWNQDFPAELLRRAAAYKGGA